MKTTVRNCSAPMLYAVLSEMIKDGHEYAVMAIGSDRATGDCVGPLVGQLLGSKCGASVFGTLCSPVTALNLEHSYICLKLRHPRGKVIAVDSCVGKKEDIGAIKITDGGLYPAAAMGKKLRKIGDISITAVVTDKKEMLPAVRLGLVYEMANAIASALREALILNTKQKADKISDGFSSGKLSESADRSIATGEHFRRFSAEKMPKDVGFLNRV